MKKVQIQNETYRYPVSFNDLNTSEFIRIYTKLIELSKENENNNSIFDNVDFVATVLNIDYDLAYQLPEKVLFDISFLLKDKLFDFGKLNADNLVNDFRKYLPTSIRINRKRVKIPKTLFKGEFTLGQLETFRNITIGIENKYRNADVDSLIMKTSGNENYELNEKEIKLYNEYQENIYNEKVRNIHKLAAIILQPYFDHAKFSIERSNKLAGLLLYCKVYDIFVIGFFLIMKYDPQFLSRIKFFQAKELSMYLEKLKTKLKN